MRVTVNGVEASGGGGTDANGRDALDLIRRGWTSSAGLTGDLAANLGQPFHFLYVRDMSVISLQVSECRLRIKI